MNLNGINSNNNIIDAQSAQKVSEQLFSQLQKKSIDYSKKNLSGFNRPTIGVDLYNQKTGIEFQRQIAIQSSGAFDKMNLNSVRALNAFAAQELYGAAITDKVGGKMTIDTKDVDFDFIVQPEETSNVVNIFETDKDKKDSNPFSYFDNQQSKSSAEE